MLETKQIKNRLEQYSRIIFRGTRKLRGRERLDRAELEAGKSTAVEAGEFFKAELDSEWPRIANMAFAEIEAANSNVDDNLGTLSGVLVLQRTLPLFKFQYPVLSAMYTDFSAEPGLFKTPEISRIIVSPAVQEYDSTPDATGRPKGWALVEPCVSIDAPVTLDSYVGIPLVFGNATLASTPRRLFDEFGPAATYAIVVSLK
jgi:hypothetical protein